MNGSYTLPAYSVGVAAGLTICNKQMSTRAGTVWNRVWEQRARAVSGVERWVRRFGKRAVMLYSVELAGRPVSTTLPAISCRINRAQERIGVEGHEGQHITH